MEQDVLRKRKKTLQIPKSNKKGDTAEVSPFLVLYKLTQVNSTQAIKSILIVLQPTYNSIHPKHLTLVLMSY